MIWLALLVLLCAICLIIGIGFLLGYELLIYGVLSNVPYVPTNKEVLSDLLVLAGDLRGKKFLDIGSGDGRVVLAAAREGAEASGIDINPRLVARARRRAKKESFPATFLSGDIFNMPLDSYDIIYCYLLPDFLKKIEAKIITECRSGTIVITNTYHFKTITPENTRGKLKRYKLGPSASDRQVD